MPGGAGQHPPAPKQQAGLPQGQGEKLGAAPLKHEGTGLERAFCMKGFLVSASTHLLLQDGAQLLPTPVLAIQGKPRLVCLSAKLIT